MIQKIIFRQLAVEDVAEAARGMKRTRRDSANN
jgi:hypothetical protein